MKKSLVSLFLAMLLLLAYVVPASADITTYYVVTSNGGPVNVRSGPGKNYSKIGSVAYGDTVGVESIKNGWATVVWGSVGSAYIYTGCLSRTKPSSKKTTTTTSTENYANFKTVSYTARVVPKNNFVNMRWAPTKSSKVQNIYYLNDTLTIIAEGKNWYQVYDESKGICGFMQKGFLEIID